MGIGNGGIGIGHGGVGVGNGGVSIGHGGVGIGNGGVCMGQGGVSIGNDGVGIGKDEEVKLEEMFLARCQKSLKKLEEARRECLDRSSWKLFCYGQPLVGAPRSRP